MPTSRNTGGDDLFILFLDLHKNNFNLNTAAKVMSEQCVRYTLFELLHYSLFRVNIVNRNVLKFSDFTSIK